MAPTTGNAMPVAILPGAGSAYHEEYMPYTMPLASPTLQCIRLPLPQGRVPTPQRRPYQPSHLKTVHYLTKAGLWPG